MAGVELVCRSETRRRDTRRAPLYGLDFVEVDTGPDHTTLQVAFLGKAPPELSERNVRISGGRRTRDLRVKSIRVLRRPDPTLDDQLEIALHAPGDASVYRLMLAKTDASGNATEEPMEGFDPRYASVDFNFGAGCPSDLDCGPRADCEAPPLEEPEINYLAKDYDSFRQLILDRLAVTLPEFREAHAADMGVALVEVLSYVADYLSYYQDAVATEAYLATARQRISVRRHARLVNYLLHEGCNARAWLTIETDTDESLDPRQVFFLAGLPAALGVRSLQPEEYARLEPGPYEIFEPLVADPTQPIRLWAAHSEIHFYTWGDSACCLPAGATSATLVDAWVPVTGDDAPAPAAAAVGDGPAGAARALKLQVGDVLIVEEVVHPATGNLADANPRHRQAVRLTKVSATVDPLYHPYGEGFGQPLLEVEWSPEDALSFSVCISAMLPAPLCEKRENLSVARGNVVLVDHGATGEESLGEVPIASRVATCASACHPPDATVTPTKYRPILARTPLTFAEPLPACGAAASLLRRDPRLALPQLSLIGTPSRAQAEPPARWSPRADLLGSRADDAHFVVELDDAGASHLRFGDGELGRMPDAGTTFLASYRIGNGPSGNVGAGTIACIVFRELNSGVGPLRPRNPMPAAGGSAAESVEEAKLFAPHAFRNVIERAVTAEDYATLAADDARRSRFRAGQRGARAALTSLLPHRRPDDPRAADEVEPGRSGSAPSGDCDAPFARLQGARGKLRWTGSWYEAQVAVDPLGADDAASALLQELEAYLEPYRRIGHDLEVRGARYVPIDLVLSICVKPQFQRGHVEAALLEVFSNRVLRDGRLGFFHPDNLSLDQDLYVSRVVAIAQGVTGVLEARVIRLARLDPSAPRPNLNEALPPQGVLEVGAFEIARLDNDPSNPDNGRLRLVLRGGK